MKVKAVENIYFMDVIERNTAMLFIKHAFSF